MQTLRYEKKIPLAGTYDVIVCGGGPAGIGAAIAAAESGAKTALIERFGFLGGMATAGMVDPMSEFYYDGKRMLGGIAWRFANELIAEGGAILEEPRGNISFNPETYKLVAQRMVRAAGVELLTNTVIVDCKVNDGDVEYLLVSNKNGLQVLKAHYYIDATGDACLASMAGVEMLPEKMAPQPATLCFSMNGVDTGTERMGIMHQKTPRFNHQATFIREKMHELREAGMDVPLFGGPWLCTTLKKGSIVLNLTRAAADATNNEKFNSAEQAMLEDVFTFAKLLRDNIPEFKNADIQSIAATAGTRQGRRIRGLHVLTGDEYVKGMEFDDTIAHACHAVDIHCPNDGGQVLIFPEKAGCIPYHCMIAENYPNLLVAGRAISADEEAFAATRVQAPCMETGQAAGIAAGLCLESNIPVQQVDMLQLLAVIKSKDSLS
jgi:hypothetical protein